MADEQHNSPGGTSMMVAQHQRRLSRAYSVVESCMDLWTYRVRTRLLYALVVHTQVV